MSNVLEKLEVELTEAQKKAAWLLVQNDLAGKDKRTYEVLAEEVEIDVRTLYNWRKKDVNFIRYQNAISDITLDSFRAEADEMLIRLIRGGNNGLGSIKALELYYKLSGRLVNKSEITQYDGDGEHRKLTESELTEKLREMNDMLQ